MAQTVGESFAAGDLLGGRYRLERLLGAATAPVGTGLWRAEDTTLARPVAIRLLVGTDATTRRAFLAAAAHAGAVRDPRLAATYDADTVGSGRSAAAYVVREWVVGEPLSRLVGDGGLDPARLGPVLCGIAEALAALHRDGGWHGRLHPDNVLVDDDRVRLTDAGLGAAYAAAGLPDVDGAGRRATPPPLPAAVVADLGLGPRPDSPDGAEPEALLRRLQRYDTCDLARVCYAASTGTWPGGAWRGLRAAPSDDGGRPLAARRVRAAVPREADAVISHVLLPAPGQRAAVTTAAGAATELARLRAPRPEPEPAVERRRWQRPRWMWPVIALVSLVVIGVIGWSVGTDIGKVPGAAPAVPTYSPSVSGTAAAAGAVIPLTTVTAFDPSPGDGHENDDQIPLAYDGSAATAWTTQLYSAPRLGNLKPGVGLLVDLGSAKEVSEVDLTLEGSPTSVELRAADAPSALLSGFPLVAQNAAAGTTVRLTAGQSHRYWLVWLTSLPKVSGGYRGGISEMAFRS